MTHNLTYTGPDPLGTPSLPEGWPAANHYEADSLVYSAKLASGVYRQWESRDGEMPAYGTGTPPDREGWRALLAELFVAQDARRLNTTAAPPLVTESAPVGAGAGDSPKINPKG